MRKKLVWGSALAIAGVLFAGVVNAPADSDEPLVITYTDTASLMVFVDDAIYPDLCENNIAVDTVVELAAPETVDGKAFSHWALESQYGTVISTNAAYRMAVKADTSVYAVYGGSADTTKVAFTTAAKGSYMGEDTIRLTATYSLPEGQTAERAGIRYTYDRLLGVEELTDGIDPMTGLTMEEFLQSDNTHGRIRDAYADIDSSAGDWTLNLKALDDETEVYAVAYIVTGGETVYGEMKTVKYADLETGVMSEADIDYPDIDRSDIIGGE